MKSFRQALVLLTALLPPLLVQAGSEGVRLPDLGGSSGGVITPQEEYRIGRDIVRQARAAGALVEDPLLEEYISGLGYRLAAAAGSQDQHFAFFLVRDDAINAFALPGGFIGINNGLLLATDSESELAGVMAHEVAHVTQQHIARRLAAGKEMGLKALGGLLGAILVGMSGAGGEATEAAIMSAAALTQQQQINFTRANEYEADRVGIRILARAGFDPRGMVGFFEEMQRRYGHMTRNIPEYLSTHPLSLSRITEARQRAADMEVEVSETRLYPLMKARLRVLTGGSPQESLIYFSRGEIADTPAGRYGRAVALQQLGRHEEAAVLFRNLLEDDDSVIAYHLGLAEALAAQGLNRQAEERYLEARRLFPGSRPLNESRVRFLLNTGRAVEAEALLQQMLASAPEDAGLYRLLAEAHQKQGHDASAHYYMSEHYERIGKVHEAVVQLRLALALAESDPLQKSRISSRLERMQELLASQDRQDPLRERR